MSYYQINNKLIGPANGFYVFEGSTPPEPPTPTLTSYSGVLTLQRVGTFGVGFNRIGEVWSNGGTGYVTDDDYGGKNCADVRNKTLSVDITGNNVSFNIINWYRQGSDYNGTANFDVLLTNSQPSYTFPNQILKKDIVAFGDFSPIYMTWSASYPVGETICVSGKINESNEDMFVYYGGNRFD